MSRLLCRLGLHRWKTQLIWAKYRPDYTLTRYATVCRNCGVEE